VLASYELAQVRASVEDATRLYSNIFAANMPTTTQPADDAGSAIGEGQREVCEGL
jgi:hypothetical protein